PRRGAEMNDLGIIENGALLIRGERIIWVGPTGALPDLPLQDDYETIDGLGLDLIALPGFVDAHTHPVFAGTRAAEYEQRCQGKTYQEIAAAGGGIRRSTRQLRSCPLDVLIARVERYFHRFLEHGTTTIEAKSGYGLSLEDEVKSLEVLVRLRSRNRL